MRRPTLHALIFCLVASAAAAAPAAAQSQQAVAQSRFNKGRELFIAGNYSDAVTEFRAATELVESPNTRLYIARCERELGHFARAYVEYGRAETEAADRSASDARYASTRDAAKQESATIEAKFGHIVVRGDGLPKDIVLTVAGSAMSAAAIGIAMPVDPGTVEVSATARGFKAFRKSAEVRAGEESTLTIALDREAESVGPSSPDGAEPNPQPDAAVAVERRGGGARTAGFVVGGAGAVGVVLFGTFAGLAQSRFAQLQADCGAHCGAQYQSQIDEGRQRQLIANVSLGAGAALLVTGAIMIAVGGPRLVTKAAEATSRLLPIAGPTPDGRGANVGIIHAF